MTTKPRWWMPVTGVALLGALVAYWHLDSNSSRRAKRARVAAEPAEARAIRETRSPLPPTRPRASATTRPVAALQGTPAPDNATGAVPEDEDPYVEAADWERMTDQELEDRGMTQAALYGAQQGMRWSLVEHSLRAAGQNELAERVNAVGKPLRGLQQARAKQLDPQLVAAELALLDELEQTIADTAADEEASTWVQELREGYRAQADGRGPNVRDKIAREREEALSGTNVDQEVSTAEEDAKHAGSHAPPDSSALDAAPDERVE